MRLFYIDRKWQMSLGKRVAKENGDEDPKVIGWDFPKLSVEQIIYV